MVYERLFVGEGEHCRPGFERMGQQRDWGWGTEGLRGRGRVRRSKVTLSSGMDTELESQSVSS